MKYRGLIIAFLAISLCLAEIQTIQVASLRSQNNVINPSIVEYVSSFRVGTKDLSDAITNQYKVITIPVVKTSYAELHQTAMNVQYVGSERTVKNVSPVKAIISNDTFRLNFNFTAIVNHTIGSHTYHCQTSISLISVNYTKEVDFGTGSIIVDSLTTNYDYKLFTTPTCLQKMKQTKDKTRIIEAVIATEGSSMFTELKKHIDRMEGYFNLNCKTEHLSKLYQTNPYVYDYYGYQVKVNVSTVQASQYSDEGVANGIIGAIINTTHTAGPPPTYQPNFTTFYSLQFIQNMIESSINSYPKWKDIKMNRLNMRTRAFRFRLIDFEYIIPNLLPKYPKYYLSDIEISCSVFQMLDSTITATNFIQRLKWKCSGSFEVSPDVSPDKKVVFLDFYPIMDHTLVIATEKEYVSVRVDILELQNILFSPVGDFQIVDQTLATNYLSEGLFQFRVYTFGTFFKVNAINKMIKLVPGVGVWIG